MKGTNLANTWIIAPLPLKTRVAAYKTALVRPIMTDELQNLCCTAYVPMHVHKYMSKSFLGWGEGVHLYATGHKCFLLGVSWQMLRVSIL